MLSLNGGMRATRNVLAAVLLAAGSSGVWAAPLDKKTCNGLNEELSGMLGAGVGADMERGPEWAKANLGEEKLKDIRHLIELEEQLEFRCGIARGRTVAKTPAATPPEKKIDNKVAPQDPAKKPSQVRTTAKSPPCRVATAEADAGEHDVRFGARGVARGQGATGRQSVPGGRHCQAAGGGWAEARCEGCEAEARCEGCEEDGGDDGRSASGSRRPQEVVTAGGD